VEEKEMRKAITMLAACLLVIGFAGMAAADPCVTCETDPGFINRGCEPAQSYCPPFDYEDFGECTRQMYSYCESGGKGEIHRALFKICDCITDGTFDSLIEGDTVDVSMEILVDKGAGMVSGDNGVFWAENVSSDANGDGVGVETFASQADACEEDNCYPDNAFVGNFDYKLADGKIGTPYDGTTCEVAATNRVVSFAAELKQTGDHGYTVTEDDAIDNNSVWWIDIPTLRVDNSDVEAGWKVYVKICLYKTLDAGGVCGACEGCCCVIYIGELCCQSAPDYGYCVYPYFPPANSTYWGLNGMVITNLSNYSGTATVMVYEADGDVGKATVTLGANQIYLTTVANLMAGLTKTAGSGTLGDDKFYAVVTGDLSLHGFVMIANPQTGESMGYIPECCGGCQH
jgi:hypothetical protein